MTQVRLFLTALTWFLTFLATAGPGMAVAAPIPAGTGPYTVDVTYDSNLYIDYHLDGVSHRSLVSIGGAYDTVNGTPAFSQIYCVDPGIPYHDNANVVSRGVGIEGVSMAGYTVVSPPEITATTPQGWNWNAISWLIINGYQGDYTNDDSVSQASVAALQAEYPSLTIDKTIALIATKVAIWQVVAGSRFQLDGVSPASLSDVQALANALVADAEAAAGAGVPATPPVSFTLALDNSGATLTSSGGYQYYGPIIANANLDNPNTPLAPPIPGLDKIFLSITGTDTAGIQVVSTPGGAALPTDDLYGTTTSTPYIDGTAVPMTDRGGNVWSTNPGTTFYLQIPASRTLGSSALTIDAVAGIADVPLTGPTPLIFIYENNLGQDWNAIQPFIGLAPSDEYAFLYAKARLTRNAPPGVIPTLDAKSLGVLALFILLFGVVGYSQQRRKQR